MVRGGADQKRINALARRAWFHCATLAWNDKTDRSTAPTLDSMDTFELGRTRNPFASVWNLSPFAPRPNGERVGYVIAKKPGIYGNLAATGPLTLGEAQAALPKYLAMDSGYHIARIGR